MKTSQCLLLLVAGLLVGLFIGGSGGTGPNANAQGIPNAMPTARFQIAEYSQPGTPGTPGGDLARHGCYILDTVTGELWHAADTNVVSKIGEKLR